MRIKGYPADFKTPVWGPLKKQDRNSSQVTNCELTSREVVERRLWVPSSRAHAHNVSLQGCWHYRAWFSATPTAWQALNARGRYHFPSLSLCWPEVKSVGVHECWGRSCLLLLLFWSTVARTTWSASTAVVSPAPPLEPHPNGLIVYYASILTASTRQR